MNTNIKLKIIGAVSAIGTFAMAVASKAADITLTASTTDVSEVTGPFTSLLTSMLRGPVAQFWAVTIVIALITSVVLAIRRYLGGKKKLVK